MSPTPDKDEIKKLRLEDQNYIEEETKTKKQIKQETKQKEIDKRKKQERRK